MNPMTHSTAEHDGATMATVLEDPRDLSDREVAGRMVTPIARLERFERAIHVTPNKGVNLTQEEARSVAERFLIDGQLESHSAAIVYPLMDLARPAPLDQDGGEPQHLPRSRGVAHEAEPVDLDLGRHLMSRTTVLTAKRPDWALDPNTDTWAAITLTGPGEQEFSCVEVDVDHPEELRLIAKFFNDAADDLEKTQAAVKASQSEAGVTA